MCQLEAHQFFVSLVMQVNNKSNVCKQLVLPEANFGLFLVRFLPILSSKFLVFGSLMWLTELINLVVGFMALLPGRK